MVPTPLPLREGGGPDSPLWVPSIRGDRGMKNAELAEVLDRMADILEILNENPFRVRSYRKASLVIGDQTEDIAALAEAGRVGDLPGIGASFAEKITEYLATGKLAAYEELKAKVPPGVVEMLHVPGLGP